MQQNGDYKMDFKDFFNTKDDTVAEAAKLLAEVKQVYEDGGLTRQQFDELVNDVFEVDEILRLTKKLEDRIRIQEGIDALKKIVSLIK